MNSKNLYVSDLDRAVKESKMRWCAFGSPNWRKILKRQTYALHEIEKYKEEIDWDKVWKYQKLTKPFLIKYRSRINFAALSYNPYLTPDIIKEFGDDFVDSPYYINLHRILKNPKNSPNTIAALLSIDTYSINCILERYRFSDQIMNHLEVERYGRKRCILSQYHKLSHSFITKHKDALDWNLICRYQQLSLLFIQQHESLIQWKDLAYNKHLTYDIVMKYRSKLPDTEEIDDVIQSSGYTKLKLEVAIHLDN